MSCSPICRGLADFCPVPFSHPPPKRSFGGREAQLRRDTKRSDRPSDQFGRRAALRQPTRFSLSVEAKADARRQPVGSFG